MRVIWATVFAAAAAMAVSSAGSAATDQRSATLSVQGRASANVSLASSGSFVVAVWSASLPAGDTDIYAATSADAGASFGAPIRVNSTPGDARVNGEQPPRVALKPRAGQPSEIAVVWTTKGPVGTRLMTATSSDGGRTFGKSSVVPGSDAPGNRGWEAVGLGPGGRFFSVWLDHRKLAPAQQTQMEGQHHHEGGAQSSSAAAAMPTDGVAMAQLSQLYVSSLDASAAPQGVTGGVCYCCKTAIALGRSGELYLAWRHVYPGNMRDIAFTVSRDGGKTFAAPVRVSEDKWQIEGCPDDGPSMVVDPAGSVHVLWPSVVSENGRQVKALFHAVTRDGRTFTPRDRVPTEGQANHPQLAVDSTGALAATWDRSGSGTRTIEMAIARPSSAGAATWTAASSASTAPGTYPVIVSTSPGMWVRAWTTGPSNSSKIVVERTR